MNRHQYNTMKPAVAREVFDAYRAEFTEAEWDAQTVRYLESIGATRVPGTKNWTVTINVG